MVGTAEGRGWAGQKRADRREMNAEGIPQPDGIDLGL